MGEGPGSRQERLNLQTPNISAPLSHLVLGREGFSNAEMCHKQLGRGPGVVDVGGAATAGIPKDHRSKASPEEDNPAPHLRPELGQPTKSLQRGLGAARESKGRPANTHGGQKNETSLCYSGFNKRRFDIAHQKPAALQHERHVGGAGAAVGDAAPAPPGRPAPGAGVRMHHVLHQRFTEPGRSERVPGPKTQLALRAPPAGAAPGHGVTVNPGPSVPPVEPPLALPLPSHGLSRGDFCRPWICLG